MKASTLLLTAALVFYVLFDIVSTLAASEYLGTFEYEKSWFLRASYDAAGTAGFIAMKVIFSLIALYMAYLLTEHFPKFRGIGLGILAGAAAAGAYVGASNFNIVYNGASFWLLGLDSGTVAALIIVACAVGGFLLTPVPLNSKQ
jgi:hypothetical protein